MEHMAIVGMWFVWKKLFSHSILFDDFSNADAKIISFNSTYEAMKVVKDVGLIDHLIWLAWCWSRRWYSLRSSPFSIQGKNSRFWYISQRSSTSQKMKQWQSYSASIRASKNCLRTRYPLSIYCHCWKPSANFVLWAFELKQSKSVRHSKTLYFDDDLRPSKSGSLELLTLCTPSYTLHTRRKCVISNTTQRRINWGVLTWDFKCLCLSAGMFSESSLESRRLDCVSSSSMTSIRQWQ